MGTLTWSTVFGVSAVAVTIALRRTISSVYKSAVTWVAVAQVVLALSALHELIVKIYFFDNAYAASELSLLPFIITGILFLRAGLAFRETKEKVVQLPDDASYVDVVEATAQLVSKPAAVGSELTVLQAIKARTPRPEALSQEDKTALKQIYLYLEDYLVSREPLAKFSRETLRESLPQSFTSSLGKQVNSDVFHDQSLLHSV